MPNTLEEHDETLSWRVDVLTRAGADLDSAERLAKADVDLHEAAELIERGCPPELAVRILT